MPQVNQFDVLRRFRNITSFNEGPFYEDTYNQLSEDIRESVQYPRPWVSLNLKSELGNIISLFSAVEEKLDVEKYEKERKQWSQWLQTPIYQQNTFEQNLEAAYRMVDFSDPKNSLTPEQRSALLALEKALLALEKTGIKTDIKHQRVAKTQVFSKKKLSFEEKLKEMSLKTKEVNDFGKNALFELNPLELSIVTHLLVAQKNQGKSLKEVLLDLESKAPLEVQKFLKEEGLERWSERVAEFGLLEHETWMQAFPMHAWSLDALDDHPIHRFSNEKKSVIVEALSLQQTQWWLLNQQGIQSLNEQEPLDSWGVRIGWNHLTHLGLNVQMGFAQSWLQDRWMAISSEAESSKKEEVHPLWKDWMEFTFMTNPVCGQSPSLNNSLQDLKFFLEDARLSVVPEIQKQWNMLLDDYVQAQMKKNMPSSKQQKINEFLTLRKTYQEKRELEKTLKAPDEMIKKRKTNL